MKIVSRYVEYMGGERVAEGKWFRHWPTKGCPVGCLDIGITLKEARVLKTRFEDADKKAGCSNFEYGITI